MLIIVINILLFVFWWLCIYPRTKSKIIYALKWIYIYLIKIFMCIVISQFYQKFSFNLTENPYVFHFNFHSECLCYVYFHLIRIFFYILNNKLFSTHIFFVYFFGIWWNGEAQNYLRIPHNSLLQGMLSIEWFVPGQHS